MGRKKTIFALRSSRAFVFYALLFFLIYATPSIATLERDFTELSLEELMNMEITSVSKKTEKLGNATAAVFVITGKDIRRSGATSIPEALRMVPGIHVAHIDANKWAITSRGFNGQFANKLLVLIDGRSVYTPLFSGVYWDAQDTLIEDVDRIEVIRGPGATLWGSNAVNGVINIITKPAKETLGGLFTAGAGTEEKGFSAIRYGAKAGDSMYYRVYSKYFDRDGGVNLLGDDTPDDWYASQGGMRIDWDLSGNNALTLQSDYYKGKSGTETVLSTTDPPYTQTFAEDVPISGGNILGRWQHTFSSTSAFIFKAYYDRTDRAYSLLSESMDTFDVDFQYRFALGESQNLIWGIGYRVILADIGNSTVISFNPETRTDNIFSFFLQDEITLIRDRFSLLIGSKFEKNDYSGVEVQPNLRCLWTPNADQSLWTSVSRAVRIPSMADYDICINLGPPPVVSALTGSREFESEKLIACEMGYRLKPDRTFSIDMALFYNRYKDLKAVEQGTPFQKGFPPYLVIPLIYVNTMEGYSYGTELVLDWRPRSRWHFQAAYSYLRVELQNETLPVDTQADIIEGASPRHQFSLRSMTDLTDEVQLDLWLRYVDQLPSQSRVIQDIFTMDVRLGWKPIKKMEISIVAQNLLNSSHSEFRSETLAFLATEVQRGVYVKLTWNF